MIMSFCRWACRRLSLDRCDIRTFFSWMSKHRYPTYFLLRRTSQRTESGVLSVFLTQRNFLDMRQDTARPERNKSQRDPSTIFSGLRNTPSAHHSGRESRPNRFSWAGSSEISIFRLPWGICSATRGITRINWNYYTTANPVCKEAK